MCIYVGNCFGLNIEVFNMFFVIYLYVLFYGNFFVIFSWFLCNIVVNLWMLKKIIIISIIFVGFIGLLLI